MTIIDALIHIKDKHGINILTDNYKTCNFLRDLIPDDQKAHRRIKIAYDSDSIQLLSSSVESKEILFKQATHKLVDYSDMSQELAEEIIGYFFQVYSWPFSKSSQAMDHSDNNQTIPPSNKPNSLKGQLTQKEACELEYEARMFGEELIEIPYGYTSIGERAFDGHGSITEVVIPDSVTSIGERAFSECKGLTGINIPKSVTSIGKWAFSECRSLKSISIPRGVISIGEWAFYDCSNLTNISIPDSVTSIGNSAFTGCSNLRRITIPDRLTMIGEGFFRGCKNLTSIIIPDHISSIDEYAFYGCDSLTSIIIPDSVTSIGKFAFAQCSNLKSVTIPDSVTSIDKWSFFSCSSDLTVLCSKQSYANKYCKGRRIRVKN